MAALRSAGTAITGAQFLLAFNNLFRVGKMHQAAYKASYAVSLSAPKESKPIRDNGLRRDLSGDRDH